VYEYASLLEGGPPPGGAHYPVLDLPFRAKLSCVAWNTYLKSHLLAADYAGIATLVDASAGTEVRQPLGFVNQGLVRPPLLQLFPACQCLTACKGFRV